MRGPVREEHDPCGRGTVPLPARRQVAYVSATGRGNLAVADRSIGGHRAAALLGGTLSAARRKQAAELRQQREGGPS